LFSFGWEVIWGKPFWNTRHTALEFGKTNNK
jgi:hypothetical protein